MLCSLFISFHFQKGYLYRLKLVCALYSSNLNWTTELDYGHNIFYRRPQK